MFSVVIPLFNKVKYIQRSIDSVLNQTYSNFEIIVVNDGSTDGSEKLVEKYGYRVKLINQQNSGVSVARNRGVLEAKFDYIAFLDADDFWSFTYLESVKRAIEVYPNCGIFGLSYSKSIYRLEDALLKPWFEVENYFKIGIRNTLFTSSSTIIHSSFFKSNNYFDTNLIRGEDLDLWFRAILFFDHPPVYNFSKLVFYSQEDENQSTNHISQLKKSLSYKILNDDYWIFFQENYKQDFEAFKRKYVYFNLFSYLLDSNNDFDAKLLLKKLKGTYLFLKLPYLPSFVLLRYVLSHKFGKRFFRNYLKFCLRYIYRA